MEKENKYFDDQEVITLGQIYRLIRDYLVFVLKKWWLLLLVGLLLGSYRYYKVYTTSTLYGAKLTFTLYEEAGGGSVSGISSLMGQFGLGNMDNVDYDRIMEFMQTRKIIGTALFKRGIIRGKEDYYANHYLREYKMHEAWEEKESERLIDFWFTHDNIDSFNRLENVALNVLSKRVANYHMAMDLRSSGIIETSFSGTSETFAVEFLNVLYDELSHFYTYKLREKGLKDYQLLEVRADSVAAELRAAETRYGKFQDTHKNLVSASALIEEVRLRRDMEILGNMYMEIVKGIEMMRFSLKTNRPYLVPVDRPVYPLNAINDSPVIAAIFWLIGGIFLTALLLAGYKFIRDIIRNEQERERLEGIRKGSRASA